MREAAMQEAAAVEQQSRIHVGIVDDHPVFRLGLRAALETQKDMKVVALAENGEEALKMVSAQKMDVMLVDLRMHGLSGVETIKRLQQSATAVRALVISSFGYDEEIYAAVKAGAQGFVHKEADPMEIFRAIRQVFAGGQAFPEEVTARLRSNQMTAGLSAREQEILQLVAMGLTNKEVAATLNLSQFTVRNHLNHATRKLDATDRTEAIFLALRTGVISLP
jgi:DNA-binding NarL/FixJ family response regulator